MVEMIFIFPCNQYNLINFFIVTFQYKMEGHFFSNKDILNQSDFQSLIAYQSAQHARIFLFSAQCAQISLFFTKSSDLLCHYITLYFLFLFVIMINKKSYIPQQKSFNFNMEILFKMCYYLYKGD